MSRSLVIAVATLLAALALLPAGVRTAGGAAARVRIQVYLTGSIGVTLNTSAVEPGPKANTTTTVTTQCSGTFTLTGSDPKASNSAEALQNHTFDGVRADDLNALYSAVSLTARMSYRMQWTATQANQTETYLATETGTYSGPGRVDQHLRIGDDGVRYQEDPRLGLQVTRTYRDTYSSTDGQPPVTYSGTDVTPVNCNPTEMPPVLGIVSVGQPEEFSTLTRPVHDERGAVIGTIVVKYEFHLVVVINGVISGDRRGATPTGTGTATASRSTTEETVTPSRTPLQGQAGNEPDTTPTATPTGTPASDASPSSTPIGSAATTATASPTESPMACSVVTSSKPQAVQAMLRNYAIEAPPTAGAGRDTQRGDASCSLRVMSITWGNALPVQRDPWQGKPSQITQLAPNCGLMKSQEAAAAYWTACTDPAKTKKNWPAIFTAGDSPAIRRVLFRTTGKPFAITGGTVIGVAQIPIASRLTASMVFEKSGITKGLGQKTLAVSDLTTTQHLPGVVLPLINTRMVQIHWTIRRSGGQDIDAGTSRLPIFVVLRRPLKQVQYLQGTIAGTHPLTPLVTLAAITTKAADGQSNEEGVVAAIWKAFKSLNLHRWGLDPASGAVKETAVTLKYWTPWTLEEDAAGTYPDVCPGKQGSEPLLSGDSVGRCGLWADFLVASLGLHGVAAGEEKVGSDPEWLQVAGPRNWVAESEPPSNVRNVLPLMLIKNWMHSTPTRPAGSVYRYAVNVVIVKGSPAPATGDFMYERSTHNQGKVDSPPGFFALGDHVLVRLRDQIYDPSYGNGPYRSIVEWAQESLDGYAVKWIVQDPANPDRYTVTYVAHFGVTGN